MNNFLDLKLGLGIYSIRRRLIHIYYNIISHKEVVEEIILNHYSLSNNIKLILCYKICHI